MKKKMAVILLSILTLIVFLLPGCASNKGGTQTNSIPKNGIVSKADLEKIAKSGGLAIYKGSDNGIDYEWTFIGQDIKDPADINLNVSFKPTDETAMRQQTGSNKAFTFSSEQKGTLPGNPTLSISVGKDWSYGTYNLYSYDASNQKATAQTGSVQVVDGTATLTPMGCGEYFFTKAVVDSAVSSAAATDSSSVSPGSSSAASSQAGGGSSGSSKGNSPASSKSNQSSSKAQTGGGASSTPAPASNSQVDSSKTIAVTITIRCDTAVKNWAKLKSNKQDHSVVPADGCILPVTTVNINQGKTVYDLLVYVCEHNRIQMQHKGYSQYGSEYIQGINNLYEKDCGDLSGWMYCVNGWYPNYGVSRYVLKNGDAVQFNYTCDLGHDLPGGSSGMG